MFMRDFFFDLVTLLFFIAAIGLFYAAVTVTYFTVFINIILILLSIFVLLQGCDRIDKAFKFGEYADNTQHNSNNNDNEI